MVTMTVYQTTTNPNLKIMMSKSISNPQNPFKFKKFWIENLIVGIELPPSIKKLLKHY